MEPDQLMPTSYDSRNKSFRTSLFSIHPEPVWDWLQLTTTPVKANIQNYNKSELESRPHPSYQINNDSGNEMVQQNQKFTVQFYMNINWYSGNVLRTLVKQRETLTP